MVHYYLGFGFDFTGVTMKSVWKKNKNKMGARLGIITDQTRDYYMRQMFFVFFSLTAHSHKRHKR